MKRGDLMAKTKKLKFRATSPARTAGDDDKGVTRDVWLATWGVVAIFLIVVLVLYFSGFLGGVFGTTGKAVVVAEQRACLKGTPVASLLEANKFIAAGYECEDGLVKGIKCCYTP